MKRRTAKSGTGTSRSTPLPHPTVRRRGCRTPPPRNGRTGLPSEGARPLPRARPCTRAVTEPIAPARRGVGDNVGGKNNLGSASPPQLIYPMQCGSGWHVQDPCDRSIRHLVLGCEAQSASSTHLSCGVWQ